MTPFPWMVSVQWGKGHHYFRGGAFNYVEAYKLAYSVHQQVSATRKQRKMNLQPRVMVWELRESIQDETLGPLVWDIQKSTE